MLPWPGTYRLKNQDTIAAVLRGDYGGGTVQGATGNSKQRRKLVRLWKRAGYTVTPYTTVKSGYF